MSIRPLLISILLIATTIPAAAETDHAQALYNQHCVACHGTEVYTREDRKVTSLEGLSRQVQRCELALGLKWFDEDIADMTSFLNERYYHFEP